MILDPKRVAGRGRVRGGRCLALLAANRPRGGGGGRCRCAVVGERSDRRSRRP